MFDLHTCVPGGMTCDQFAPWSDDTSSWFVTLPVAMCRNDASPSQRPGRQLGSRQGFRVYCSSPATPCEHCSATDQLAPAAPAPPPHCFDTARAERRRPKPSEVQPSSEGLSPKGGRPQSTRVKIIHSPGMEHQHGFRFRQAQGKQSQTKLTRKIERSTRPWSRRKPRYLTCRLAPAGDRKYLRSCASAFRLLRRPCRNDSQGTCSDRFIHGNFRLCHLNSIM
jgi:hypothetical protein